MLDISASSSSNTSGTLGVLYGIAINPLDMLNAFADEWAKQKAEIKRALQYSLDFGGF